MTFNFPLTNIAKKRLEGTTLYVDHLVEEYWMKTHKFTWNVDKFFNLSDIVIYTCKIKKLGWELRLQKKRDSVTVIIHTKSFRKYAIISCCILYDAKTASINTSPSFDTCQLSRNLYEVTLPPTAVKTSKNFALIQRGVLRLQFKANYLKARIYQSGKSRRDCLSFDKFHTNSNFVTRLDFTLYPKNSHIRCHKALLASRSNLFRELFTENAMDRMLIYAPYEILSLVVYFIYSGKIFFKDTQETLEVIKLTWRLNIHALKRKFSDYILDFININNVHIVKEEGIKGRVKFLENAAESFLEDMKIHNLKQNNF